MLLSSFLVFLESISRCSFFSTCCKYDFSRCTYFLSPGTSRYLYIYIYDKFVVGSDFFNISHRHLRLHVIYLLHQYVLSHFDHNIYVLFLRMNELRMASSCGTRENFAQDTVVLLKVGLLTRVQSRFLFLGQFSLETIISSTRLSYLSANIRNLCWCKICV